MTHSIAGKDTGVFLPYPHSLCYKKYKADFMGVLF